MIKNNRIKKLYAVEQLKQTLRVVSPYLNSGQIVKHTLPSKK